MAEYKPVSSLIVGVDLAPTITVPRVITFQSDITTDKRRETPRGHPKTWKADTILHNGTPNVGTALIVLPIDVDDLVGAVGSGGVGIDLPSRLETGGLSGSGAISCVVAGGTSTSLGAIEPL